MQLDAQAPVKSHTISILLENEAGALCRVANMFSARAYNIESLTVAPTEDPSVSRMTVVTSGSEQIVEQISKQLNKLIDVIRMVDLEGEPHIERELMLVKVAAKGDDRDEITRLCEIFRGRIVDVTEASFIIELTGESSKLDAFVEAMDDRLVIEVVRSGVLGILRGQRALRA